MKYSRIALAALPTLAAFPLLLCMTGTARADDTFAYGKLGLGAGVGIGTRLNENFSIRGGINGPASRNFDRDIGGNNHDVKAKIDGSLEAMVDWFPYADNGFRVTAGMLYLKNFREELKGNTNSSGNYNINNRSYTAGEVGQLSGSIDHKNFAPYLGVGWESALASKKGWRFIGDAGVMVTSGGSTSLSTLGSANNAALRQDVEAERQRVAADFGDRRRWSLLLSLGAAYSF